MHYADKLAEGASLVPIEERLAALRARYPRFAEEMQQSWPVLQGLQQEICDRLNLTSEDLIERLRESTGFR